MTYKELAAKIAAMDESKQNCDVTFYDERIDEYFALIAVVYANPEFNDVLDPEHPYLIAG
jgi:hypothetical protein